MIDKRETGGNLTVMEREGLRRLLERVINELPLNALCTHDASSTIIKLVRDMKGRVLCDLLVKCSLFSMLNFCHISSYLSVLLEQCISIN